MNLNKIFNTANILMFIVYAGVFALLGGFIGYTWYVWQYVFNTLISPIFAVGAISYVQAVALAVSSTLITGGHTFSLQGIHSKLKSKPSWLVVATPFVVHFLTWLLVG